MHKINGVAWNTPYVYDPAKLHWGPRSHGKFTIKPGPNGPVGVVWIDLNAPSYGIHGTPDPTKIGKTASHGCVRLTNWDATALAQGVKPGVQVKLRGGPRIEAARREEATMTIELKMAAWTLGSGLCADPVVRRREHTGR